MKRLILFIGDKQCLAATWKRGLPESSKAFPNSDEGRSLFDHHIQGMGRCTVGILADLVEEDYRVERIPHLLWRDRARFLSKRLEQYYRFTPFRNAAIQGREGKEDRVLFSALIGPNLVLPWIELLERKRIPLSGICSVSMLSDRLVSQIPVSHVMLISFQNGTGLRQSFFLEGCLNFSRLTQIHPEQDALAVLRVESDRAYHYLHALNLLPEGRALLVCILCCREDRKKLETMLENTRAVHHVFIDPEDVAKRIGFKGKTKGSDSAPIFMHLMASSNQYGAEAHTHIHDLGQWINAAYAFSASLFMAALILAGIDASRSIGMHRQAMIISAEKEEAMSRLGNLVPRGAGPVSPERMKDAVMLSKSLAAAYPDPSKMLAMVSRSLSPFEEIRIDRMSWKVGKTSSSAEEADLFKPGSISVFIDGEIYPFDGNFRRANETVDRFCSELKKNGIHVEKENLPLNPSPDISLTGSSGQAGEKAPFSLSASWSAS